MREGDRLGAHLSLAEPLSEGATSTIWRAHHEGLGADVAVKVMHAHRKDEALAGIRFAEEARIAAQLRHPNILRVFDQGLTDEGDRFIVMELLEGETLGARLGRDALTDEEAFHVVVQMGKALAAAHARGVVHRDVKLANVFLCDDEPLPFVKLLDFGLAKRLEHEGLDLTATGSLLGTLPYMSPEQLAGEHVDHRADLWAFAVVAYLCLTRRRPFAAASVAGLMQAQRDGEFAPCAAARAPLPPAVDAWFARAFAIELDARFADAPRQLEAWRLAWGRPAARTASSGLGPVSAAEVETASLIHGTEPMTRRDEDDALTRVDGDDATVTSLPLPRRRLTAGLVALTAVGAATLFAIDSGWRARAARLEVTLPRLVAVGARSGLRGPAPGPADVAPSAVPAPRASSGPSADPVSEPGATRPPSTPLPSRSASPVPVDTTDDRIDAAGERFGI